MRLPRRLSAQDLDIRQQGKTTVDLNRLVDRRDHAVDAYYTHADVVDDVKGKLVGSDSFTFDSGGLERG